MQKNDRTNWLARLAGKQVETFPNDPDFGLYRNLNRERTKWDVYYYWYNENGDLRCLCNGFPIDQTRALELWLRASENAITDEQYHRALAGEPWADLNETVTRLNQAPDDDSYEGILAAIDALESEAKRYIAKGAAQTKVEADAAGDVADKLGKLWKAADDARDIEKRPHRMAAAAVDDKWRPVLAAAEIYKRLKSIVCQPFIEAETAKKRKAEAEARRQAEAAARVAREAAEKARQQQEEALRSDSIRAEVDAEKAADAAEAAERAALQAQREADHIAAQTVTAGTRGRGVHLRSVKTAKIINYDAALAHFSDYAPVKELIQKLANAAIRAGTTPDGCEVHEEQVAA